MMERIKKRREKETGRGGGKEEMEEDKEGRRKEKEKEVGRNIKGKKRRMKGRRRMKGEEGDEEGGERSNLNIYHGLFILFKKLTSTSKNRVDS